MNIKVIRGDITAQKVDAIIVNLFEGVQQPGGGTGAVDQALGGGISQLIASGEIKGKINEVTIVHTLGRIPSPRVAVAGLGKQTEFTPDRARQVAAVAARAVRKAGAKTAATITHGAGIAGMEPEAAAQALAEGTILGLYRFRKYLTKKENDNDIEEFSVVERDEEKASAIERGVNAGHIMADSANVARDLVNEPSNYMTPTRLAEVAVDIAGCWLLEVQVMEREEMEKLGMGGILAVAKGSAEPPKFIVMSYKGDPSSVKTLGLVGKGLTFDSGGISIKPSEHMEEMKGDMAGAASVIAAMNAIAQLRLKVNVTALVGATENMPSGTAQKPGDILKTMSGKTVEVVNTDAEGRLTLADVLTYARKLGLSPVIDVATLTGACHIALGDVCTGAFGNNQDIMNKLIEAGEQAGECVWQMPMMEEYKQQNKSDIADIKNSGGRYGGAITAAQFLAEFVEDTPWVHLDIAGTFMRDKERGYLVKGATGVPVRTLVNAARGLAAS
ncbi:MAG: leucyl aminopeptidase [Chloroflexi bacterium]|nr:leucyl aminopeptidase [Chloroflexota bacterium]